MRFPKAHVYVYTSPSSSSWSFIISAVIAAEKTFQWTRLLSLRILSLYLFELAFLFLSPLPVCVCFRQTHRPSDVVGASFFFLYERDELPLLV